MSEITKNKYLIEENLFYLEQKLPTRPENKEGVLIRLDPIKKQWYYYYPKYINVKNNLELELTRRTLLKILRRYFIELFLNSMDSKSLKNFKAEPEGIFDRWLSSQIQIQDESKDPLIPTYPSVDEPRIIAELLSHKISSSAAKNLCGKLCAKSQELAFKSFEETTKLHSHKTVFNCVKKDSYHVFIIDKFELKISQSRLLNLSMEYEGDAKDFNLDVCILLLRYDTLGGNGMQAAVPPQIMNKFTEYFGVKGECFASPLNHHFPLYCSAFPDTDLVFGSSGSFFNFYPTEGVYEANPPFMELIMQRMVEHMEEVMYNNPKVGFIIVVPKWSDDASPMWALLTNSPYKYGMIDIDKKKHKYLHGYQHANASLWVAQHITSVFVLKGKLCPISDIKQHLIQLKKDWENMR